MPELIKDEEDKLTSSGFLDGGCYWRLKNHTKLITL